MYVRSRDGTAELPLSKRPSVFIYKPFFSFPLQRLRISPSFSREENGRLSLYLSPHISLSVSRFLLSLAPSLPSLSLRFTFAHLIFILFYSLTRSVYYEIFSRVACGLCYFMLSRCFLSNGTFVLCAETAVDFKKSSANSA